MRLGVFGSGNDPQAQAVARAMRARGCDVALVDTTSIRRGVEFTFDADGGPTHQRDQDGNPPTPEAQGVGGFVVDGQSLADVRGWYMRHILSPMAPAYRSEDGFRLYADWFVDYMQKREHSGFQLSWLHDLGFRGIPVVNPPEHGGVVQLKTFQLSVAQQLGLTIPRTCVTNSLARMRTFATAVAKAGGDVVFKPSMGGGLCEPLDDRALHRLEHLPHSPTIFQQRIYGDAVRATFVGNALVSAVVIPADTLDYRADGDYAAGRTSYSEAKLPAALVDKTLALLRACGLLMSGVDFIRTEEGEWVFLEANSSPIFLDVELKTGAPISDAIAGLLLDLIHGPLTNHDHSRRSAHFNSFVRYASPFAPKKFVEEDGVWPPKP
jgi:glutathione synthase/RimK-type ligase-like ATP-grasp enzyme